MGRDSIAFSIICELTSVELTSHPVNSKFSISRDPLANQDSKGLVLIEKINSNIFLRGNLQLI